METIKEIIGCLSIDPKDSERCARLNKSENDFFYFCKTYLAHMFFEDFSGFHREVIEGLTNNDYRRIILAAPREHGKTHLVFLGYVLWAALFKKHNYMVIFSASSTMSRDQMFNIKIELENNELILSDFGNLQSSIWRKDNIRLTNNVEIKALGAECSTRGLTRPGQRPDLIIFDDLEKDRVAHSKVMRGNLYQWVKRVAIPLGKEARLLYIGTILNYDSVLKRLMVEFADNNRWFIKKYAAILKGTIDDLRCGRKIIPLWPEYWSQEKLQEKLEEIGSAAFSTEYLNEPLSSEDMVFHPEWFEYYENHPVNLDIITAVDPAVGKDTGDFSAIVTIGKDNRTGIIYVLDANGYKCSDNKLVQLIIDQWIKWNPSVILFEDVAFQSIYQRLIAREASAKGYNLPLKGVKPAGKSKDTRIRPLADPIENKVLQFKTSQQLLIGQMEQYHPNLNNPDDLVDALAYAVNQVLSVYVGGTTIKTRKKASFFNRIFH